MLLHIFIAVFYDLAIAKKSTPLFASASTTKTAATQGSRKESSRIKFSNINIWSMIAVGILLIMFSIMVSIPCISRLHCNKDLRKRYKNFKIFISKTLSRNPSLPEHGHNSIRETILVQNRVMNRDVETAKIPHEPTTSTSSESGSGITLCCTLLESHNQDQSEPPRAHSTFYQNHNQPQQQRAVNHDVEAGNIPHELTTSTLPQDQNQSEPPHPSPVQNHNQSQQHAINHDVKAGNIPHEPTTSTLPQDQNQSEPTPHSSPGPNHNEPQQRAINHVETANIPHEPTTSTLPQDQNQSEPPHSSPGQNHMEPWSDQNHGESQSVLGVNMFYFIHMKKDLPEQ